MSYSSVPVNASRFIYHFLGLAPVATNIVTPLVVHYQLKNKPISPQERKLLVMQEVARQITSGVIGLLTYYGGAMLTGKLFKSSAQKSVAQIVGGTIAQFIGYGFLRPLISTELILQWLKKVDVPPSNSLERKSLAVDQQMQGFIQAVQQRSSSQFRGQIKRNPFQTIA